MKNLIFLFNNGYQGFCFSAFFLTIIVLSNYSTHTDKSLAASLSSPGMMASCNFLSNPEFDSGTTGWNLYLQSGSTATLAVDNTSQLSGVNSAHINITATPSIDWHVQLVQLNTALEAGKEYVVSFQARANTTRTMSVAIQQGVSPWANYFYQSINLTTTGTTYGEFSFVASATDPTAQLIFNLGDTTGDVYIDEVVFCTGLPDCFLASDDSEMLTTVDTATFTETDIGATGNDDFEAIEFDPVSATLYGASGDDWYSFDVTTGATTYIGKFSPSDDADGLQGVLSLNDVDGLARDPINNIWYGANREDSGTECGAPDILFQFDPLTGNYTPGAFADYDGDTNPDDYVEIQVPAGNNCLHYIDDLGFDPYSGKLYGIANGEGAHSDSTVIVEINPVTGAVINLGTIEYDPGTGSVLLEDVEGFTIASDGRIFITTGDGGNYDETLFELTGLDSGGTITATFLSDLNYLDYEAITCMLYSSPSQIGDFVFNDLNGDGDFDLGEPGIAGITMLLINPVTGDTISTTTTNGSGNYNFSGLPPGQFIVAVDETNFNSSAPLENFFPTVDRGFNWDNKEISNALSAGVDDLGLDFGYKLTAVENCSNGIDDDGDGYADCFDSECPCYAPITCDGRLYQTIKIGSDFWLYEIVTDPVSLNPLLNLTTAGVVGDINNAYYNNIDGFIYFMNPGSPYGLYRVNALYEVELMGNVTGFPTETINAAGNNNTGDVYFRVPSAGDFYQLDPLTLTASLSCDFPASSWPQTNIGDFAYNPITDKYYGTRDDTNFLIEIDPVACTQDTIMLNDTITGALGAFFVSADGTGYGYANSTGDLYRINLTTGLIDTIGAGASTSNTDGCSCSTVLMTKAIAADTICITDTISYTFTIFNQSGSALTNLTFHDTLASGFRFVSDPYNITGITFTGSTAISGSTQADLSVQTIATGIMNSFQVDVAIDSGQTLSTYSNRATLSGLPPFLPSSINSDNPGSIAVNDATNVVIQSCPEICDNAYDDDGDGNADCADMECCCAQAPVLMKK